MMDAKKRALPSSGPGGAKNVAATANKKQKLKPRKIPLKWSEALHRDFVSAVFDIGVKHASPAVVLDTMLIQDKEVTSERVKSHLQKYRVHKERSKTEFLADYDKALKRIKERGGTQWRPTDRFLGGDVAAAMAYYSMNPDASMPMPIDMRMSAVAGPTNIPTPREEYTELTQDGAIYSDHIPASRRVSGPKAGGDSVPIPSPQMHPVVSTGTLKTDLDESSRINLPNLTDDEAKSALGQKLRQLTDDYNSTINHLLEGRKSGEGCRGGGSQHTPQDSRDSIGSRRRTSNQTSNGESHESHPAGAAAATSPSTYHYDASMYNQSRYTQYPIHPQGYVPPDGAQSSSSANHHHYSGYDYYSQQATSAPAPAPAPAPVSYSIGPSSANNDAAAYNQDDSSTKTSSVTLQDSKATPLYESQRVSGDGRYSYGTPSSGGRGRGRSGGTPSNKRSSPIPESSLSRPSPAASPTASPAASPTTRSMYQYHHNHPGADQHQNQHYHHSYNNNMYYNNNASPAPSPSHSNQSWTHGYNNNNNYNGYSSYNYGSSHHSQPHHHYDTHRGDTKSNRGTSSASAHIGQSSGQSSAPQDHAHDYSDHGVEREQTKTPTSRIGGSGSLDLGDPWDDVDVEFSPIAH